MVEVGYEAAVLEALFEAVVHTWTRTSTNTLSEEGRVATAVYFKGADWSPVFSGVQLANGTHYAEVQLVQFPGQTMLVFGVATPGLDVSKSHSQGNDAWCMRDDGSLCGNGKSYSDRAGKFAQGDRMGVLVNLDDGTLQFFKNGEQHGPGYGAGSVRGPVVLMAEMRHKNTFPVSIKLLRFPKPKDIKVLGDPSYALRLLREAAARTAGF